MSMELLTAAAVGIMTMSGIYLLLRARMFSILLGLTLLSYAVNVFVFASGRLRVGMPPIVGAQQAYADPLAQALVLTAIVISFAMTAFVVVLAIAAYVKLGHDRVEPEAEELDR